jgi:hypothetical protein
MTGERGFGLEKERVKEVMKTLIEDINNGVLEGRVRKGEKVKVIGGFFGSADEERNEG